MCGIKSIIVWGDSILKGVVSGGDSKRFEITENDSLSIACKDLGIALTNKSVFGSFMTKTLRTQEKNLRAGLTADVGIIQSATNDSDYDWQKVSEFPHEDHQQRCPLDQFVPLMEKAVQNARENKITPVIATSTPLVPEWWFKNICIGNNQNAIELFLQKKYNSGFFSLYQNQELFSLAAMDVAFRLNVQLVDIRSRFLAHADYKTLMCLDGVHPNQAGYNFMANIWKEEIPLLDKEF